MFNKCQLLSFSSLSSSTSSLLLLLSSYPSPCNNAAPAKSSPQTTHPILPFTLTQLSSCLRAAPVSVSSDHLQFDLLSSAIKGNNIQLNLGVSVMGLESEVGVSLPSLTTRVRYQGSVSGEKTLVTVKTHGLIQKNLNMPNMSHANHSDGENTAGRI